MPETSMLELAWPLAERAQSESAARYYWMTQENNATARALYDKVAKFNGFIRYEFSR